MKHAPVLKDLASLLEETNKKTGTTQSRRMRGNGVTGAKRERETETSASRNKCQRPEESGGHAHEQGRCLRSGHPTPRGCYAGGCPVLRGPGVMRGAGDLACMSAEDGRLSTACEEGTLWVGRQRPRDLSLRSR